MDKEDDHARKPRRRARRGHLKSRQGCQECKRRHVKCDERRPECTNCSTTSRKCPFLESDGSTISSSTNQANQPSNVNPRLLDSENRFTLTHLICLHHAEMYLQEFMALRGDVRLILDIAIKKALTAPFLLEQVLALSASHLAYREPIEKASYEQEAVKFQTHALELFSSFNTESPETTEANYLPMFIFASLLGIHVLRDTFSNPGEDLSTFIEKFGGYLQLHRGVGAVISKKSWKIILESDIKPLLYVHKISQHVEKSAPGTDTLALSNHLASSNLEPDSLNACQSALKHLQWVFDMCKRDSSMDLGVQATMAWPLRIPQEYIEVLEQRRPEALVVLAYYAAVLHRYRYYWIFGGVGSFLINLISAHVGPFWHDQLEWPKQVLMETQSS